MLNFGLSVGGAVCVCVCVCVCVRGGRGGSGEREGSFARMWVHTVQG